MFGKPPPGLDRAHLFRLLIALPVPTYPLSWRSPAAPDIPLHVVALRGVDVEEAIYAAKGPGMVSGRVSLELLTMALHTPEGRAFADAEQAGALLDGDAAELTGEALAALAIISPTFARSDGPAWVEALREGAKAASNIRQTLFLGACEEHGFGVCTPRPDLYFGRPIGLLTDGQLMAYDVARSIVRDMMRSK